MMDARQIENNPAAGTPLMTARADQVAVLKGKRVMHLLTLLLPSGILLLAAVGSVCAAPAEGPFFAGGKRKQAIIVAGSSLDSKERNAPKDLSRYLERVTGASVPLRTTAAGFSGLTIHVGRSEYVDRQGLRLDDLHMDGYVIKLVDEDNLVIVGGKHLGTGFGVYDFLKKVCGCRWFMPGPLGEVVPKRKEIVLNGLAIRSEPSVQSVWLRPIHIDNLKVKHFRRYHWAGHNLKRLIPPEQYGKTRPQYYPFWNGERQVPLGRRVPWQPCVTNPDLPKLVPEVASAHFAKNPLTQVFSMGVNDGGGDCLCEKCQALDAVRDGERFMSNRYARFYTRCANEFAKAFPDKLLGFHSYGGIWSPPTDCVLPDNVYVRITGREDVLECFEEWSRCAKHLGIYDYLYGVPILEPRHYPHVLGELVKTLVKRHGLLSYSAEVHPIWPFDGPKFYVLSELLWDIDQDVDVLLDDYFTNFYAESASPMKAFFQRMEDVYCRRPDPRHFFKGFRVGGFFGWEM